MTVKNQPNPYDSIMKFGIKMKADLIYDIVQMHKLFRSGAEDSPEAEAIREKQDDRWWLSLTDVERRQFLTLSDNLQPMPMPALDEYKYEYIFDFADNGDTVEDKYKNLVLMIKALCLTTSNTVAYTLLMVRDKLTSLLTENFRLIQQMTILIL